MDDDIVDFIHVQRHSSIVLNGDDKKTAATTTTDRGAAITPAVSPHRGGRNNKKPKTMQIERVRRILCLLVQLGRDWEIFPFPFPHTIRKSSEQLICVWGYF